MFGGSGALPGSRAIRPQIRQKMKKRILTAILLALASTHLGAVAPVVADSADADSAIDRQLGEIAAANADHAQALEGLRTEYLRIERGFQRAIRQMEITTMDKSVGESLRRQRALLPDSYHYGRMLQETTSELATARLAKLRLQERMEEGPIPLKEDDKALLQRLEAAYSEKIALLGEIATEQQRLIDKVAEYRAFLDENLLWIANVEPIDRHWLGSLGEPLADVFSPSGWIESGVHLLRAAVGRPWISIGIVFLAIALFAARPRFRSTLVSLAGRVGNVHEDRFAHTLYAAGLSILYALPWPLILRYSSWLLRPAEPMSFDRAVSRGLWFGAEVFLVMALLRALYLPRGLAESHFRWKPRPREVVSRNLAWLMPVLVFTAIVLGMTESSAAGLHRSTMGRLAYGLAMFAILLFSWRVLRKPAGVLKAPRESKYPGLAWRARYLWYPLSLIAPVALMAMAARGRYLASLMLAYTLFRSIAVVVLTYLIYLLAVRWLLVAERRLALKRTLEKKRSEMEARASREAAGQAGELALEHLDLPEIGLETISEHARRLVRMALVLVAVAALWFTWIKITLAFGVFEKVALWQYKILGADGEQVAAVTVADCLLAGVVLLVAFASRRNLPGLLEIAVLQPLAVEPGNRHAVVTIARYVIVAAGIVAAMVLLGVQWGEVQWLVAALGVGLGFGLKEIVSNFVCGLIILFERPIRIGDTVTIGGVSGVITRIRIRSTSLTDWDNREMIIPNQKLIVEPLTNWTLSDQITRLRVSVGIAYGSDTEKAHRIMLETVTANPLVLAEPAPTVLFLGFGESSLNFDILVFVKERIQRLPLTHELHMALERALRENGIQIPFPQRVVHLRGGGEDDDRGSRGRTP